MRNIQYYNAASLAEYIKIIKGINNNTKLSLKDKILYRGESQDYHNASPKFLSSAMRSDRNPIEGYETAKEIPYIENVEKFKFEVYREINNDIREQFLAYSQHHGIRTNLIDVSSNPLVALYFTVEKSFDKEGYVYIINSPLLDVTDVLTGNDTVNLLDILISNEINIVKRLVKKFWGFGHNHIDFIHNYFKSLFTDYINLEYGRNHITSGDVNDHSIIFREMTQIASKDPCDYINTKFQELYRDGLSGQKGFLYFCLLREFVRLKKVRASERTEIDNLLPMTYKPSMNFKRGINQNGSFLYQNYIHSMGNVILDKQNIEPDHVVKITEKEKIMEELDVLNINKKFIYGDHSNIAEYIEDKHEKLREELKKDSIDESSPT